MESSQGLSQKQATLTVDDDERVEYSKETGPPGHREGARSLLERALHLRRPGVSIEICRYCEGG